MDGGMKVWPLGRSLLGLLSEDIGRQLGKLKHSLELNLAKELKYNRKAFFNYAAAKTTAEGSVGPLLGEVGGLMTDNN